MLLYSGSYRSCASLFPEIVLNLIAVVAFVQFDHFVIGRFQAELSKNVLRLQQHLDAREQEDSEYFLAVRTVGFGEDNHFVRFQLRFDELLDWRGHSALFAPEEGPG